MLCTNENEGSKVKKDFKNSGSYAFALGVFITSEMAKIEPKYFITNPEVKTIYSKILQYHQMKKRKGITQNYADGLILGGMAYELTCRQLEGTDIAINACLRLLHMKHEELITRVFKIDSKHFITMKKRGIQDFTMPSVKFANKFLDNLDNLFNQSILIKGKVNDVSKVKDECKRLGHKHTLSEKQFNECMGIEAEEFIAPTQVRPKQDRRTIDAIFSNYVKVESDSR